MKKRILAIGLVMMMIFNLAGCGNQASSGKNQDDVSENTTKDVAEETTQIFKDDCGREVELPANITKIVASGPVSQIILYPLVADEMVGLSYDWGEDAKEYIPDQYYDLPYFGQMYGSANLNIEELAKVGPEVVVDIGEAKKSLVEDMEQLTIQTGIESVHVDAGLATMADAYRKLGKLFGKEERAEELAVLCENIYNNAMSVMEKVGENKMKSLFVVNSDKTSVFAKGSFHGELVDLLTENQAVIEDFSSKGSGDQVDMEQIALWNPDVIIFGPECNLDNVKNSGTWGELQAVASGQYILVPNEPHNWVGSPAAVNRFVGLILLPAVLYPEYCDYDVKTEIQNFYQVFYNYELTDEHYEELTKTAFFAQ